MCHPCFAATLRRPAPRLALSKTASAEWRSEAAPGRARAQARHSVSRNRSTSNRSTPNEVASSLPDGAPLFFGFDDVSGFDALIEVRLVEIVQADPGETHLVDGALTAPHPVFGVGIVLVIVGVVVPGGHVNDRPCGQQRSHILGVWIRDAPAELVIAHATERLGLRGSGTRRIRPHVRIDGLHALGLAARVEVRLKRRYQRRLLQTEVAIAAR